MPHCTSKERGLLIGSPVKSSFFLHWTEYNKEMSQNNNEKDCVFWRCKKWGNVLNVLTVEHHQDSCYATKAVVKEHRVLIYTGNKHWTSINISPQQWGITRNVNKVHLLVKTKINRFVYLRRNENVILGPESIALIAFELFQSRYLPIQGTVHNNYWSVKHSNSLH